MKTIGQIIREKRKALGLKQCELASKSGIVQRTLCAYEKDTFVPNLLVAADLADALNCSLDELCGRKFMKFITVHDANNNPVLVNLDKVAIIKRDESGNTKIIYIEGAFGICKETMEELENLIYDT